MSKSREKKWDKKLKEIQSIFSLQVASTDKPFGVGASLIALESESVAIRCLYIIQNFCMIYKGSAVMQIIHDMHWTFKESQIKYIF